jgi:hypothetical protein
MPSLIAAAKALPGKSSYVPRRRSDRDPPDLRYRLELVFLLQEEFMAAGYPSSYLVNQSSIQPVLQQYEVRQRSPSDLRSDFCELSS